MGKARGQEEDNEEDAEDGTFLAEFDEDLKSPGRQPSRAKNSADRFGSPRKGKKSTSKAATATTTGSASQGKVGPIGRKRLLAVQRRRKAEAAAEVKATASQEGERGWA